MKHVSFADRILHRQSTPERFLFDSPPISRSCRHFCDATTATLYRNIVVGLSSEPVGPSFFGYESFEPGIVVGGVVATPPVPTSITVTPIFRVVDTCFSPVMSFSNRASAWVGLILNCSAPPLAFHPSSFPSLCYLFCGSLNPPGLVRDLSNVTSDPSTASSPTT